MNADIFTIDELIELYPDVVDNDQIDYKKLSLHLAADLCDIKDQLIEKDYQILRITERLDKLGL